MSCNILPAPPVYASTGNDWCKTQDIAGANKLLDEAGWVRGADGIRAKDGVRLSILYQTSTNSVRQGTQALIKQMWRQIGVETEAQEHQRVGILRQRSIEPGHLSEVLRGHPDVYQQLRRHRPPGLHAELDLQGDPRSGEPVIGNNIPRYCNPEYDKLAALLAKTAGIEKRAVIARRMNDMLIDYGAFIRWSIAARWLPTRCPSAESVTTRGTRPCGTSRSGTAGSSAFASLHGRVLRRTPSV